MHREQKIGDLGRSHSRSSGGPESARILPPRFSENLRRADRQLQHLGSLGHRSEAQGREGGSAGSPLGDSAGFLDRHRRRRQHHRLQRQRRARPGNLHRADAIGGRRTLGALQPRQADLLRYGDDARSGVTSGSQSHPTNFNHGNLAQAGATAREALFQMARSAWTCRSISSPPPTA